MSHRAVEQKVLPADLGAVLLAATSDGVIIFDQDSQITQINPAAAQLLGADIVGAAVTSVLPPAAFGEAPAGLRLGTADWSIRQIALGDRKTLLLLQVTSRPRDAERGDHEQQLYGLLMTISSALDIPTILNQVARLTMELFDADASSIPLYDSEYDRITTGWIFNLPAFTESAPYSRSGGMVWDVIDSQAPLLINNYALAPRAMPGLVAEGVTAVMAAPITGIDRTIFGVLAVYQRAPHKGFTRDDLEHLVVIGRQTGIAMQNARLYADIRREADRRHMLYLASVEIGAALDPQELYSAIHRAAGRLMTCDSFALGLYDEDRQDIDYVYIIDQQGRWPSRRVPSSRGLLGHVIRNDISLRLSNSDPSIEMFFGAERMHSSADITRSILAVAMHTGQQIIGAMTVQAYAPDAYTSTDLDALEMLASTAAIATQNARLFARIQELATIDPLTQVPNRRHFFETAARELERTDRYKRPVSLIIFDIDSFKAVNDTFGHLAGDQVLREVAARCRSDLRDIDTVARFGGEEFVALLPETTYERALQVAQRLCASIGDSPIVCDAGAIAVTISVGVDSCDEVFAGTLSDLIDRADQALYVAKHNGRNRVIGFRSLVFGRSESHHPSAELKKEPSRS